MRLWGGLWLVAAGLIAGAGAANAAGPLIVYVSPNPIGVNDFLKLGKAGTEKVAKELGAPLDVFLVRKLGVPGHEELAMGAIATGGVLVLDERVLRWLGINEDQIQKTLARELDELRRREATYRDGRPLPDLKGKTVILVDDGLATGASMQAAAGAVRRHEPARIVVAVPVASRATCDRFRDEVDEVVCAVTPEPFYAVGNWYEDFSQTSDEEVRELLARAAGERGASR